MGIYPRSLASENVSPSYVYDILHLAVLIEPRLVTDRQTDRHWTTAYTAIA